ncbi:redoxin domain-containing protein [bacterium]|nr:redoxin domain-containing protein [bacterium]MDA7673411.1 redoxin domain-containing protein [Verrucomicrobiales bacterium]
MKIQFPIFLFLVFAIVPSGFSEDKTAPPLVFKTLSGKDTTPLKSENGKPVVVAFITTDCPIANGYAPELNRIVAEYSKKDVKVTLVHVDPDLTLADAKIHTDEYALKADIVLDPTQKLVAATEATITPEAVVYSAGGKQIYRGRINNQYSDLGDRRNTVSDHTLRNAIDAALAGKPMPKANTPAVGCFIPEK